MLIIIMILFFFIVGLMKKKEVWESWDIKVASARGESAWSLF